MDLKGAFGYVSIPFTREFRVEHCMRWPGLDLPVESLYRAVQKRLSGCLLGGSGLGKTVILRRLASKLTAAHYDVQYVHVAGVPRAELCRQIARLYQVPDTGAFSKLFSRLQRQLLEAHSNAGLRPVLLLDEAQDLRPDTLEWIRLLTNFDMDSRLVLSVVLAGLPSLGERLRLEEHAAIARRMHCFVNATALSREDLTKYVEHRCTMAGGKSMPFDTEGLDAVFEIARGNLSASDTLCLHALELAAQAKITTVSTDLILKARNLAWP